MRRVVNVVAIGSIVWLLVSSAWAQSAAPPPATSYAPLVRGWEQFFKISWEAEEEHGRPYIAGYVSNDWGFTATRVQLLVDGLDSAGEVASQTVTWLAQPIPPHSRMYFRLAAPQPAARYQVRVFAFDWLQTASIQAP